MYYFRLKVCHTATFESLPEILRLDRFIRPGEGIVCEGPLREKPLDETDLEGETMSPSLSLLLKENLGDSRVTTFGQDASVMS